MSEKSETEKLLETAKYYVISAFEDGGEGYITVEEADSVEGVYQVLEGWYANADGFVYSENLNRLLADVEGGNLRIVRGWEMGVESTVSDKMKNLILFG